MSEVFTVRPNTIGRNSIISLRASLSASDYRTIKTPVYSKKLSSLIRKFKQGRSIGGDAYMSKSHYRFLKTVNINELFILDETKNEYCKPCKRAVVPKAGSILIAKDGGGHGLGECCVYEPKEGIIDFISAEILSLEFIDTHERNYVLGMLKSLHFKEFIDGGTPGGSTFRHSKLLSLDYDVPWSNDELKRQNIAELVENMIHKECLIESKNVEIDKLITNELSSGLITGSAKVKLPSRNEILDTTRLDAGIYTDLVRETNYLIENYKNSYYRIPDYFKINRGQNLQVTAIGERYDSDTYKKGFYRIFTNIEMTDMRTITGFRWLGNKKSLTTLPQDCVMFAADGMIVGRSFFFDVLPNTITNIHPWVITSKNKSQPRYKSVFLSLFLSYLKNIGYLEKIKDKSNGGGLKKNHINKWIKIPCFSDNIQEKIAAIYYQSAKPLDSSLTIKMHKKRNETLGIFQLNMEVLAMREKLAEMVSDIIISG